MTSPDNAPPKPPSVSRKTAKGKGNGGFSPHPEPANRRAPFDPDYRANIEPPPVKPVGKKTP